MIGRCEVLRSVLFVVISSSLVSVGCTRQGMDVDEAVAANKELDRKFVEAFKAKNLDAMMSHWWKSSDAVFYPADDIQGQKGWDAIRAYLGLMVHGMENIVTVELTEPEYVVLGEAAMGTGVLAIRVVPKGSPKEITLVTRYTNLRRQVGGTWVYVYGHESMNPMLGVKLL